MNDRLSYATAFLNHQSSSTKIRQEPLVKDRNQFYGWSFEIFQCLRSDRTSSTLIELTCCMWSFGYDKRKNFIVHLLKNTAPRYPASSKTSSTDWGIASSSNTMVVSSCSVLTEMRLKKIQLETKQTLGYLKMWLWCIRVRFNRAKQLSIRQWQWLLKFFVS